MKEFKKDINRLIAIMLLWTMSFNIFGVEIEVDKTVNQNVYMDKAPNGVPLVSISTPNQRGISLNTFSEFNVGNEGLEILNNTGVGRGYLSGLVTSNPNLVVGQEAKTVVFQVSGANRSDIEGYISALSPHKIDLFIANENGIYANGAGYINVNRAILTTGKVNIQNGDIVSFTTKDGKIIIGEKGLDVSNVERVDIITRTQEITGKIVADKNLNITLGQNDVDLAGVITPIITSTNKPALALNGGALGSIYSNGQIQIISTEKGVGVNLKSSIVSEEDLKLQINGNSDLNEVISKKIEIKTEDLKTNKVNGNEINIVGKDYENIGKVIGNEVTIKVDNYKNNELLSDKLKLIASGNIENNKMSVNVGEIEAGNLKTTLLEGQDLNIKVSGNTTNNNQITANNLNLVTGSLNNEKILAGNANIISGTIVSNEITTNNLKLKGSNLTTNKILSSNIDINVSGNILNNGNITGNNIKISTGTITNNEILGDKLELIASGNVENKKISVNTGTINADNVKSNIIEGQNINIKANNEVKNIGNILANTLNIDAKNVENKKIEAGITTINADNVKSEEIEANTLKVVGNNFINSKKVDTGKSEFDLKGKFENNGEVTTNEVKVKSNEMENNGKIASTKTEIKSIDKVTNNGEIISGNLEISGKDIENNKKIEVGKGNIISEEIINNDIIIANDLDIKGKSLVNNTKSTIFTTNTLKVTTSEKIINEKNEEILSQGDIELNAPLIQNKVAKISGAGNVKLTGEKVENIGEVIDLTKYSHYWEYWDGRKVTNKNEMKKQWERNNFFNPDDWSDIVATKNYLTSLYGKDPYSYIFTNLKKEFDKEVGHDEGNITINSDNYPIIPIKEKLKSDVETNYAVITGGNVEINASKELNNTDAIISSDNIMKINSPKVINKVTIDESNPISLHDGVEKVEWRVKRNRWTGHTTHPIEYVRTFSNKPRIGYVAGSPSIIEGKVLIMDTNAIVSEKYEEAKGTINKTGVLLHQSGNINGQNISVAKNIQSITDIKNTGVISINTNTVSSNAGGVGNNSPLTISNLYIPTTNPSSKYRVETRAEFVTRAGFYGGEYFLTRVGYKENWDRVKLLGDAYYDNLLIEKMLMEKLGTIFINRLSGSDLVKTLIDNSVTAKTDLNLQQGIGLTKDQINGLKNDIIWYEYVIIDGVKTLVPKIYLSQKTLASLEEDGRSKIYGTDVTLVNVNGSFENNGMKIGSTTSVTMITANDIKNATKTNERSEIVGKQVRIEALTGNIENIGGKITSELSTELVAKNGNVVNNGTKETNGFNFGEYSRSEYESVKNIGEISSSGRVYVETNGYNSTAGALTGDTVTLNLQGNVNLNSMELEGSTKIGQNSKNYSSSTTKEHIGSGIAANTLNGVVNNINLQGSTLVGESTKGLLVKGNVNAESVVNVDDRFETSSSKNLISSSSSTTKSHTEENVASDLKLGEGAVILGGLNAVGSNVYLGQNTYVGGKVTTDSRELHNSYSYEEKKSGFSANLTSTSVSVGYGKSENNIDQKSIINAKSTLFVDDGSVLNQGANITATDFVHGQVSINNGDVVFGAKKDIVETNTSSKSSSIGLTIGINSPILDRVNQGLATVGQIKSGDVTGGLINVGNTVTGVISGLAENQGKEVPIQSINENGNANKNAVKNAMANNNFYVNVGVNLGFNKSKSESNSHIENAVVSTITGKGTNSTLAYNNVNNITYEGTLAKDTTMVYNNVNNVTKEAVELHNSSSSESSSVGISAGATIGYGNKVQTNGNGANVSMSNSDMNTVETRYENGNFQNVNEVHNNTGTMILSGFNQSGGVVTGNIGKVVVESKQNTSTTTGSSSGVGIGISANGIPNSVNLNHSETNGSRSYVDKQSTFTLEEGSNLHVGTLENTGTVIGKESENNTTFKIDSYVGKNLQDTDTMNTTGGGIGLSTGQPVTSVSYQNENREKEGITRNTVIGNVEIGVSTGEEINREISKAQETTKDESSSTNITFEPQLIRAITNPNEYKKEVELAKQEIEDLKWAVDKSVNDMGDDNRNFFGQLGEVRLSKTIENIAGERLANATTQEEIAEVFINAYGDLGYENIRVIFTTPENAPQLYDKNGKPKTGTAYIDKETKQQTIIINVNAEKNHTKSGLIGTIAEEGSHIIGKVEGRQIIVDSKTNEKGLESTGRATGEYFIEKYGVDFNNSLLNARTDGIDTSGMYLGETVGNDGFVIKIKGSITVGGATPEVNGAIYVVRNPYTGINEIVMSVGGGVKVKTALAGGNIKGEVEYYPGVVDMEGLLEERVAVELPLVKEALSKAAQYILKIPKANSNINPLIGKSGLYGAGIRLELGSSIYVADLDKIISNSEFNLFSPIKDAINDMINKKLPNVQINRSYKIKSNWFDRETNSTKLWRGILDSMKEGK